MAILRSNVLPILLLVCALSLPAPLAVAGRFGEHKLIGDRAFQTILSDLNDKRLLLLLDRSPSDSTMEYVFVQLFDEDSEKVLLTYGDLTALSGDHSESPLQVWEELHTAYSRLRRVAVLQHSYLSKYAYDAPDLEMASIDPLYLSMAIIDKSHFYDYNKTFSQNIAEFDSAICTSLHSFAAGSTKMYTNELYNTNAINKYITLHACALQFAKDAAASENTALARTRLQFALFVNAYADHFIQDAFSSGHRVVHRSHLGSFVSNKFLHDYFCAGGLPARNLRMNVWLSYGDFYYDKRDWENYGTETFPDLSENNQLAIDCNATSIREVFESFANPAFFNPDSLPSRTASAKKKYEYFIAHFGALSYIPIPYKDSQTDDDIKQTAAKHSSLPERRQAVKRRLAEGWNESDMVVQTVTNHKGIGLSLFAGRYGASLRDPHYSIIGWYLTWKGAQDNFTYNNKTFEHESVADWWTDVTFGNLYTIEPHNKGTQFKLGVNNIFDLYFGAESVILELGWLNEIGFSHFEETRFRWEPSFELGIFPHSHWGGVKARFSILRSRDFQQYVLGLSYDIAPLLEDLIK